MDVRSYCDSLETQLTGWKAKIYDAIRVVDRLGADQKEAAYSSIRGLHRLVDEIDAELENLKTACPADWSPNRRSIDANLRELQHTLKELSGRIQGPIIPDSLSWVSQ
jgi:hypothetical protein